MVTATEFETIAKQIERIPAIKFYGSVTAVKGLVIECQGLNHIVSIGSRCSIETRGHSFIAAEVVGFRENTSLLMPFANLEGVGMGCKVWLTHHEPVIHPSEDWLGRVINAFGEPIDDKGSMAHGHTAYLLRSSPPAAHQRARVEGKCDLGIRAINSFLTCCHGQRMGIFAGSGVGKSMLMSMLAKYCVADVKVVGLIGERGREVQEFIQDYLGEEGLKNTIVVVATGDESALMRRQAAYVTLTISEYFRDLGKNVLCMMDSITRFAMAQREIGLSAGEPPTTKGYTPTVFSEMPKLLERAGPGIKDTGTITAMFSVLVDGDDHNEPIADAARSILDGHIVLDRTIAERGRYPAINILKSVSRTLPKCNNESQNALITRARGVLTAYEDMAELIRLGAYKKGSNPAVDEAIALYEPLQKFLHQHPDEHTTLTESYQQLATILSMRVEA